MWNDLSGMQPGDPPKAGDLRTENGMEYVYSTTPDLNGQPGWNEHGIVINDARPALVDDGLAQYSNTVRSSAEFMMSNIAVVAQVPISIKKIPGQIPYQIRQAGISLPYPAAVINRGPTEYEARKNAYAKYQINKLRASQANPAFGALDFFADDVMGTADAFYDSFVNYSEGNVAHGTANLGFGLLALSGYTGGISRRGLKIINISDDIARAGSKNAGGFGLKAGYTYRQNNAMDPGLDEFIASLEAANIPVLGKNLDIVDNLTGRIVGEIDVLTPNAALQYKHRSSSPKEVIAQITERTEPFLETPVIGFVMGADGKMAGAIRTVKKAGPHIMVTNNINSLINVLK